jgi:DNA-binding MarR family transcriptional regulator
MDDAFFEELAGRWNEVFPELDCSPLGIFSRMTLLAKQMDVFHSEVLTRFGITHAEYGVLGAMRIVGPPHSLSPTQLRQSVRQTPAGITKTLGRLERAGLIIRYLASGDRRSLLVELTAAGIEMAERLFLAELAAQQARLKGLSYAQRRRLLAALRVLNRMLDSPAPTVAPKQEASRSAGRTGLGEEQNAVR